MYGGTRPASFSLRAISRIYSDASKACRRSARRRARTSSLKCSSPGGIFPAGTNLFPGGQRGDRGDRIVGSRQMYDSD